MSVALPSNQSIPATPLAGASLSCVEICERTLRKIGAYAINDDAADPDQIEEALAWLDLLVKNMTGTQRCYWLSPATVTFNWPAGVPTVNLADALGASYPSLGIQFPVRAWLVDGTTGQRRYELELCRRRKYEELQRDNNYGSSGNPTVLYIDRLVRNQTASVFPVPQVVDPTNPTSPLWQIALEVQTYSQSVLGEQGGEQAGDVSHGFSAEWELWLVTRLASEIGNGPVKSCALERVVDWREEAKGLWENLTAYANKEKTTRRPVTRRYDIGGGYGVGHRRRW